MKQFALAGHRLFFAGARPAPLLVLALLLCQACAGDPGADPATARASAAVTTSPTPTGPTCDHWGSIDFFRDASPSLVRECLRAGADPNGPPGVYPLPPLFVAAGWTPHPTVISILIEAGADPTARHWGGLTPLHEAAGQQANPEVVAALLDAGGDPGARDRDGVFPLHLAAARNNNPDVVTAMVEAGADPNAREASGNTPLHLAWTYRFFDHRPVVRELLRLGADPLARNDAGEIAEQTHCDNWNTGYFAYLALPADYVRCLDAGADPNVRDGERQMLLHRALEIQNPEVTALLLEAGADPNAANSFGNSPLMQALWLRSYNNPDPEKIATELVRLLLAAGADPNADRFGNTPLYSAASQGAAELVDVLLEAGADPNPPTRRGTSPLGVAIRSGHTEVIRLLEAAGAEASPRNQDVAAPQERELPEASDAPCDITDWTLLHQAPPESIHDCLEAGAQVDAPIQFDGTPLMSLVGMRLTREDWARIWAAPRKIAVLLAAGADSNAPNEGRETPLHRVVSWDGVIARSAVTALIEAGADVNAPDRRGQTPLHRAAARADSSTVARLLLQAGADVSARTNLGETPLHLAASRPRGRYAWEDRAHGITALLEAGAEVDARTGDGRTPLHVALESDRPAAAIKLLEAGADPMARDLAFNLADPMACERWGKATFFALANADVVAGCLEAGADANPTAGTGDQTFPSLLHLAAPHAWDPAVITTLVQAGAVVGPRDGFGRTPLHAAAESPTPAAVRALLQAGADVHAQARELGRSLYNYPRGYLTPLHTAASNPNPAVAAALLEAGADVGARAGYRGGTPLHEAARNPNPEVAELLLSAGANVHAREFARGPVSGVSIGGVDYTTRRLGGITPLHVAARLNPNPEVLAVLLEAGADPTARAWRHETHYNWSGNVSPLYDAARSNPNPEIAATLLAAGANVDGRGAEIRFWSPSSPPTRASPLYFAVRIPGHPAVIEVLARAGADLELTDSSGRTALHHAAITNPAVFPLLLRLGANPDALDAEGKTPMDYARENPALQPWERIRMSTPLVIMHLIQVGE